MSRGGKRTGAGRKPGPKKTKVTWGILTSVYDKIKELGINDIGDKVSEFLESLVISERMTQLQLTSAKIEALKDIVDACYQVHVSEAETLEDQIDLKLYMKIQAFRAYDFFDDNMNLEESKMIYLEAVIAFMEFMGSTYGDDSVSELFLAVHPDLREEFNELQEEI